MSKSLESPILSDEHYQFLQLDQRFAVPPAPLAAQVAASPKKSEPAKPGVGPSPSNEEQSLREFNAELLQRIGDYRKRNLEFSANENALKNEMAAQSKRFADREREITLKFQKEIDALKKAQADEKILIEQADEDWNRKLAKLSDDSWAKGLEIETLKRAETDFLEKIEDLQSQVTRSLEAESNGRAELEAMKCDVKTTRAELDSALESEQLLREEMEANKKEALALQLSLKRQIEKAQTDDAETKQNLNQLQGQMAQLTDAFRAREAQLASAYEALRKEYSNLDACLREANESIAKLQQDQIVSEKAHQDALVAQEQNLRASYEIESANIRTENAKLREMLSVRDTRLDQDRAALTTWREQLGYLDQHLRQMSDNLKKSRAEALKTAKAVAEEVQFALQNPFTDYLEIAQKEAAHLEAQLTNTSSMSPLRQKLEARQSAAQSHRDSIQEILDRSQSGLSEHSKTIQSVLKSLESLTL